MQFRVEKLESGMRLDLCIASRQLGLSRSHARYLIEQGCVTVNGITSTKPAQLLRPDQIVELQIPENRPLEIAAADLNLKLLFEDDQVAVIDKPSGLSVHPSTTETGLTLVHGLLHQLQSLSGVGGVERPGIVHRIDKGTSGLLIVSKTDDAHHKLSAQFQERSIGRKYLTLAWGVPSPAQGRTGRIESLFGRSPSDRKKMTSKVKRGKKAITNWTLIKTFALPLQKSKIQHFSLIECRLETGRTHQIRVHLSEAGLSIIGDPTYGANARHVREFETSTKTLTSPYHDLLADLKVLNHQLLHAATLEFDHPTTGKRLRFEAPLPKDFSHILQLLEQDFTGARDSAT